MRTVRVFFAKQGRAVFTSHLDVSRAVQRALKRSGLPVWYTEGFHPHIYLTFALPLSLGVASRCESFDMRLTDGQVTDGQVVQALSAAMPPDLPVVGAAAPVMDPKEIAFADYRLLFSFEEGGAPVEGARALSRFEAFCAQPAIPAVKKTKKGPQETDIRPLFSLLSASARGPALDLEVRCAAGPAANLNPSLLLGCFAAGAGWQALPQALERTALYNGQMAPFC